MLDGYVESISRLRDKQTYVIDGFLQRRCREESDLDFQKLRRSCYPYIEWVAVAVTAAFRNLQRRKWTNTANAVREMAVAGLTEAEKHPVNGQRQMPTLLGNSFFLNNYLWRRTTDKVQLVSADPNAALQVGMVLVGQPEVKSIDEMAKSTAGLGVMTMVLDIQASGESSQPTPPEKIPTLQELTTGGRALDPVEKKLVGRWVFQDYYSSGGFSARFDSYMILLADGACARTSKTVASSTFRDSSGNWAGFMDSGSGLSPGERGKWTYRNQLLTLTMDDSSVYEYRVTSASDRSMMTRNTASGEERFWSRG
jgi:hypothetical protein